MSDVNRLAGLLDYGRDVAQGASNAIAGNVSVPVDGLAWLLRKAGVPMPSNPMGGSDWMTQRGLTPQPQNRLAGLWGEAVGMSGPMVAAAKAARLARGLLNSAPTATNTVAKNYQSSRLTGKISDPQPVPQRSFFDDYPQAGIKQPDGTRLTLSIDGAPLSNSATIAGRNTVGGMDQGLSHESIRSNADALGARFGQGTSRNLGKDLGRYNTGRGRDGEVYREILTRKGLTESELPHVIGHESGHLFEPAPVGRTS